MADCPTNATVEEKKTATQVVVTPTPVVVRMPTTAKVVSRATDTVRTKTKVPVVTNLTTRETTKVVDRGPPGPQGPMGPPGPGAPLAPVMPNSDVVAIKPGQIVCRYNGGYALASPHTATMAQVVGIAIGDVSYPVGDDVQPQCEDVMWLTQAQWEDALGTPGGLATNRFYYLGLNGTLVLTPPPDAGFFVVPVGLAISPTQLHIRINSSVLI